MRFDSMHTILYSNQRAMVMVLSVVWRCAQTQTKCLLPHCSGLPTDKEVLAGLLNGYRLVVHLLPCARCAIICSPLIPAPSSPPAHRRTITTGARPSQRRLGPTPHQDAAHPAHAGPNEPPRQGPLRAPPGRVAEVRGLALHLQLAIGQKSRRPTHITPKASTARPT
jgi:hypothetical protein